MNSKIAADVGLVIKTIDESELVKISSAGSAMLTWCQGVISCYESAGPELTEVARLKKDVLLKKEEVERLHVRIA